MLLEQLHLFDQGLRRSLEIICRSSVTDMAWLQATLPIRLGLREAVQASPAAYVESCNSTRKMVQDFLKKACNLLNIANLHFSRPLLSGDSESHLQICHYLKSKHGSSTLDFSTATQRQIQSEFDSDLVKYLLNTANLRDRARLNSISTSHAGAWLRAIPNSNLGLSMSPHEFVIAVRLWDQDVSFTSGICLVQLSAH